MLLEKKFARWKGTFCKNGQNPVKRLGKLSTMQEKYQFQANNVEKAESKKKAEFWEVDMFKMKKSIRERKIEKKRKGDRETKRVRRITRKILEANHVM